MTTLDEGRGHCNIVWADLNYFASYSQRYANYIVIIRNYKNGLEMSTLA